MKPQGTVLKRIRPTRINDFIIQELEVDLKHINFGLGLDKEYKTKARSHLGLSDVVNFFESLDNVEAIPEVDEDWEYFVFDRAFFQPQRIYRIVFCVNVNEVYKAGVITLYQIKKRIR